MKLIGKLRLGMSLAFALSLLAVMAAQPVAAYEVIKASGSYGTYIETDTQAHPGAHCYYYDTASSTDMYKIKIPAPQIFARDRTTNRDKQKVGWLFVIQHGTSPGSAPDGWVTSYKSSIVKDTAYDDQAAPFTTRTWNASANINRWWRVEILMLWYHPGSSTTLDGKVKLLIDYYKITYPPNPDTWEPSGCLPDE